MFIISKNSKTNEPHKFVINFSGRLDLGCSSKLITWGKI